ncbi:winged helix-turn-helix domain-containing protein [Ensifer aridi]|uniref:winged helix-turn-helix domain-containing protein n=1 Tax=Ensifer aridi TaxID=1708715 RepID=UPI00097CB235|nr:winged helix-turn-helix domain-containing protein [Ensifer aridi]
MANYEMKRWPLPLPTVLVAVADDCFRSFLEYAVKSYAVKVAGVNNGEALSLRMQEFAPDVLLLEAQLPGVEFPALCARLREARRTRLLSIIALAGEEEESSRQDILECGGDDYLCRPFSPERLIESIATSWHASHRVHAIESQEPLTFGDLELDVTQYHVRRGGRTVHLPPIEFRLLRHLMRDPLRVYSREELQEAAWASAVHLSARAVDVHISRLRTALNQAEQESLIRTVRSVGYALSERREGQTPPTSMRKP